MNDLARRVLSGDTRAAGRLCRRVDDRAPGYRDELAVLYADPRAARILGITGSPGAGKSTLVDRLVGEFRKRGDRVGVVAVDPTSPFTGGAILGDRIRMQRHFEDPEVFIRSVATRGALGGLSRSTRDVVRVLESWGAAVVLVETVGVGQDEIDVTRMADSTAVVLAPGQGDDVQAIKAGILECADVLVVNKADRPGADATARDLDNMLALGALSRAAVLGSASHATHRVRETREAVAGDGGSWTPPVLRTVASTGEGVPELVDALSRHGEFLRSEAGAAVRTRRARGLVEGWLRDAVHEDVARELAPEIDDAARRLSARGTDPHTLVDRLVHLYRGARTA